MERKVLCSVWSYVAFGYTLHSLLIQSLKLKWHLPSDFNISPYRCGRQTYFVQVANYQKNLSQKRQKLKLKTNDGILENLLWSTQTKINN